MSSKAYGKYLKAEYDKYIAGSDDDVPVPANAYYFYGIEIRMEFPPNIGKIQQNITLGGKEIFAWDKIIYNPSGGRLTTPLLAHEKVHFNQQEGDPETWWEKYLSDVDFRLEQELEAHRAEYKEFCKTVRDREKRLRFLAEIAGRLAGPLYGGKLTHRDAMGKIR